jgi:hypothetical protein
MPAEPKYGLPAHTTMAGTFRIGRFAKRGWGRPKTDRRPGFLNSASPHPSFRRTAKGSERAGEFIGPDRVVAPIRIDGPSRRCREEWSAERMYQDGYGKDFRQIVHKARPRLFISLSSPRGYSHGSVPLACYRKGTIQAKRCESVAGPGRPAGPTESAKAEGKYRGGIPTARAKAEQVFALVQSGKTRGEAAEALGISIRSVFRILRSRKDAPVAPPVTRIRTRPQVSA